LRSQERGRNEWGRHRGDLHWVRTIVLLEAAASRCRRLANRSAVDFRRERAQSCPQVRNHTPLQHWHIP
jgi:hypothetical protein